MKTSEKVKGRNMRDTEESVAAKKVPRDQNGRSSWDRKGKLDDRVTDPRDEAGHKGGVSNSARGSVGSRGEGPGCP